MNSFNICSKFGLEIIAKKDITKGLINNTSLVTDRFGKKYILQEINHHVFKDVEGLMNNIDLVTEHIKKKTEQESSVCSTLSVIKTPTHRNYVMTTDESGKPHYYRVYSYIDNASSYDEANEELLYQAGVGFGKFQRQLTDFPATKLVETIPHFHDTVSRFEDYMKSLNVVVNRRDYERVEIAKDAIQFAYKNKKLASVIMDPLTKREIPLRVVHNDTKLNNVMLDNTTHEPVCVIDLDTIMPGSLLFDYGDAIRYGCNSGQEDDANLNNIQLDLKKFQAFTNGFLKETCESITKKELALLPMAPVVLAYELGLRFLTDYLDGNKYFKCDSSRPLHNLDRATAQFKLAEDTLSKQKQMTDIIQTVYHKNLSHKQHTK